MLAPNATRRTGDAAGRDSGEDPSGSSVPTNSQDNPPAQGAIRAELIGDDTCVVSDLVTRSTSPVLAMARKLIAAGTDPGRPMWCYRGEVLCLIVASIGTAAGLEIGSHGTGFITRPERRAALACAK
jgi:hypothetical protein